jgi:hypothetical protein
VIILFVFLLKMDLLTSKGEFKNPFRIHLYLVSRLHDKVCPHIVDGPSIDVD